MDQLGAKIHEKGRHGSTGEQHGCQNYRKPIRINSLPRRIRHGHANTLQLSLDIGNDVQSSLGFEVGNGVLVAIGKLLCNMQTQATWLAACVCMLQSNLPMATNTHY